MIESLQRALALVCVCITLALHARIRPELGRSGVRPGKAQVGKGLDPDITRRIVRAHINELRSCYAAGLAKDPTLAGRVVIAFEVAATGKVSSASVKSTKLVPADDHVPTCMAKAFKRWAFLRPTTGKSVKVVYPVELSPDASR
jgi:hypothetical protein